MPLAFAIDWSYEVRRNPASLPRGLKNMAFSIPALAFESFSYKQSLDSLWRLLTQWEQQGWGHSDSPINQEALNSYLDVLTTHESTDCQNLAIKLKKIPMTGPQDLQDACMTLERLLEKDVVEQDFLISTEDTAQEKRKDLPEVHLILDNLRSSFNVGSLFRSAEAFGAAEIHLCGYTATPENSKTAKSALGADNWVKWRYWESSLQCLEYLKKEKGLNLYAFETCAEAKPLRQTSFHYPAGIILGNERYGLAKPVLNRANGLIEIPLAGRKNSLNVGVCGALALEAFLSF